MDDLPIGASSDLYPRLLDDVRYVECQGGVYIQSEQNSCVVTGEHAYQWIHRLAPHWDGTRSLAEIAAGLPSPHQQLIRQLTDTLLENHFIMDSRQEAPHTLSESELKRYAGEIAFIRYRHDSAEARFQRLRTARILLTGDSPVASAISRAGRESGWQYLDSAESFDFSDETAAWITKYNVVVQVETGDDPARLARSSAMCARAGVPLAQAWVRTHEVWLTGVLTAERAAGPAWYRLPVMPEPGDSSWLTGSVPQLIAAQTTLSCFRHLTGTQNNHPRVLSDADTSTMLHRFDVQTLETTTHRFRRPAEDPARHPEHSRAAVSSFEAEPRVRLAALLGGVEELVDPHLGPLHDLSAQDLPQLPLPTCMATIPAPLQPSQHIPVLGWGTDGQTARARAAMSALAVHAALLAREAAWGTCLVDGSQRRVVPTDSLVGVAAGQTWGEAVEAGLLAHCEALLADRSGPPVTLPAECTRLLDLTGERYQVHELTGVLGLPAYTVSVNGMVIARAVAATPGQAQARVMERALLYWQAQLAGQPQLAGHAARWPEPMDCGHGVDSFTRALQRVTELSPVAIPLPRIGPAFAARVVLCDD
ncbi:hypothetical protein ACIP98_39780 [Streptomyces sp. NPDC088354]|uniref:hypothetical protein n=1 Tax=Streptomyces sp. NPDC088354 TaxID=3365856 RepID=UPI00381A1766